MNPLPDPFSRLIAALEPWLDQVIIIGGWAHQLYRWHPTAQNLDYAPLMTLDTDIAVPPKLPERVEDIRSRLLAGGFTEERLGDDRPPATHYRLAEEPSGFYVEFLTGLSGGSHDRKGKRKATIQVAGVASQRLRYVEILLHHPWLVDIRSRGSNAKVQIANPVSFVAQKILIHEQRERNDRAKDILYIHDTLEVFGARLDDLCQCWKQIVAPQLRSRKAKTVSSASGTLFGQLSDDIRRAAQMSGKRRLSPEAIREACQYGFSEVFQ